MSVLNLPCLFMDAQTSADHRFLPWLLQVLPPRLDRILGLTRPMLEEVGILGGLGR